MRLAPCQTNRPLATGNWQLAGGANEYSSHLLVHHQLGEYDVPLEEDRIAKFMIDRLVH